MPKQSRLFGAGRPFLISNISNPTPMRFGLPQDMSLDFKRATKPIFGENMLPEDIGGGEMTVTGKVSMGELSGALFTGLFGGSLSAGTTEEADNEMGVVAAATPFKITVANSATWTTDLGVKDASSNYLSRVAAGSEVSGVSYSVAAGVYTFAAADAGVTYYISYLYTVAASGHSMTLANAPQGSTNNFTVAMVFMNNTYQNVFTLDNCISSDLSIASKNGDWTKPSYGFEAATNDNDNLGSVAFAA